MPIQCLSYTRLLWNQWSSEPWHITVSAMLIGHRLHRLSLVVPNINLALPLYLASYVATRISFFLYLPGRHEVFRILVVFSSDPSSVSWLVICLRQISYTWFTTVAIWVGSWGLHTPAKIVVSNGRNIYLYVQEGADKKLLSEGFPYECSSRIKGRVGLNLPHQL